MTEQSTGNPLFMMHHSLHEIKQKFLISVILMMATGTWDLRPKQLESPFGRSSNRTHLITRCWQDIHRLFYELGYSNTRRAYRMKRHVFWNLCLLLREQLEPEYDDPLPIVDQPYSQRKN
jgi:hypothetical protein